MDLIDEIDPVISVMSDLLISVRINKKELALACQKDHLDLTFKMEKEVRQNGRSLREVKRKIEGYLSFPHLLS